LIIGGSGQVGASVVRALVALPSCVEVVMVNRKASPLAASDRLRQVILDTAAAGFQAEVTKLALRTISLGDPVYGASCVGVGKGSAKWSEEELKALELGVVGGFARGCHDGGIERFALLSAVGSSSKSRIRYVRIMGLKEETVAAIGFKRLAIFRPGIIGRNKHTPGYVEWLGRLIPRTIRHHRPRRHRTSIRRRIHQQHHCRRHIPRKRSDEANGHVSSQGPSL
jgi:hypothetical protein